MSRLDNYRSALQAARLDADSDALVNTVDALGPEFVTFIVDHGLGPLWHERTQRDDFREVRMQAEALYLAQENALREISEVLNTANIDHALIKGAANRQFIYDNPALRACHDLDILVRPDNRVDAARAMVELGFAAGRDAKSISRELELSRSDTLVDLHWSLLREGRLRRDITKDMLRRRRNESGSWVLDDDDALFVLLVHPAFAKHLAGWDMGLHRVVDLLFWVQKRSVDWPTVRARLEETGACTAAWATLRWAELLAGDGAPPEVAAMRASIEPGHLRRVWLEKWLRSDFPARTAKAHWLRLAGFTSLLHDTPRDALRAISGRYRARRRADDDLAAFDDLFAK